MRVIGIDGADILPLVVKRYGDARFIRRFPHHIPISIPNRPHGIRRYQLRSGKPELGDAPQLLGACFGVMVGQARQRCKSVRIELAELHRKIVVDAKDDSHGLAVLEPAAQSQNTVDDFGSHSVPFLVFDSVLWRRRSEYAVHGIRVKAGARFSAQAHRHRDAIMADVFSTQSDIADVADDLAFMNPSAPAIGVFNSRHPLFPGRGRLRDKKISGQIPKIQMTIGRNNLGHANPSLSVAQ